ncbi:MAG: hypothetical protein K2O97_12525, partial [Acetatifactor sp.]|nr:hypothetical protein [Acetatifactor sp.]
HEQMEDLDGATATCTITVNIETNGDLPEYASGTGIENAVSSLGASVGSHTANQGNTPAGSSAAKGKGTANTSTKVKGAARVTGDWGVREAGRTLVGELGRELWVHAKDGSFETVGDSGPEFIRTEKGDLIFDHLRTRELLSKGRITEYRGLAAESLPGDRIAREYGEDAVLTPDGTVLLPYDPHKDPTPFGEIYRKWHAHMAKLDDREREDFLRIDTVSEKSRKMPDATNQINNTSIVTQNNRPSINVGDINITCPGVTSQAVMREVRTALTREFSGFRNYTDQWIRR